MLMGHFAQPEKFCEEIQEIGIGLPVIALVTGGSRGLGLALVEELANKGFIVLRAQRTQHAKITSVENNNVKDIHLDLANQESVSSVSAMLIDQLPYIDLLINNAAICPDEPGGIDRLSAYWQEVMDVNFCAAVQLTENLLPLLHRSSRRARVINISSGDGELLYFSELVQRRLKKDNYSNAKDLVEDVKHLVASLLDEKVRCADSEQIFRGQPAYKLSKAALNAYTRFASARKQQHARNSYPAFVSVCPGDVDTGMGDSGVALIPPEKAVENMLPLLDVNTSVQSGIFLRNGAEIAW